MTRIALTLCLGVVAAAALSLLIPAEAQEGGGRSLQGWWLAQALSAVALAAALTSLRAGRSGFLAGAFLIGCAGQLALTSPLWLQFIEMRPDSLRELPRALGVAALLFQLLTVGVAARSSWTTLRRSISKLWSLKTLGVLIFVLILTGAHLSVFLDGFPEPFFIAGYVAQLLAAAAFATLNLVHLFLFAHALPESLLNRVLKETQQRISFPGSGLEEAPLDARVPWLLAGISLVVSLGIAVFVFERMPHVQDEAAFLFQARQLASLGVSSPAPPELEAHSYYLIDTFEGRWHATTKPGWPAVLALGAALGVPWLINPLLGALAVLVLHALTLQLTRDRGTAHLVAALTATSPWHLFLAGSMMGHTLPLVVTAGAFLLVAKSIESGRWSTALTAGLMFGLGVLIRPIDGLVVGALAGLWILVSRGLQLSLLMPFSAGCVAATLPILPYNMAVAGGALADPMQRYLDRIWFPGANRLGFGDDIGPPGGWGNLDVRPGHDLFEVLVNANQNLYNIHFELLGWTYISILPLVAHLAWARWASLERKLLIATTVLIAALSIYWFSGGPDFGARYWYLVFIPLMIWSAQGISTLSRKITSVSSDPLVPARIAAAVSLLAILSLSLFCSWRAVGRYVEYRDVHADYQRLLEAGELSNALVIVEALGESEAESALLHNHPSLPDDRPIFIRSTGNLEALRKAYPDRPIIRLRGRIAPSDHVKITGDGAQAP